MDTLQAVLFCLVSLGGSVFVVYRVVKHLFRQTPKMYCTSCGSIGKPKTKTKGSLSLEIILWLCFLIPGFIYSLWRTFDKTKACVSCGNVSLIPTTSPIAQEQVQALGVRTA